MRQVIVQSMLKRRRKKTAEIEPVTQQVEQAANSVMSILLVVLAVIVIGSIAIGA